MRAIDILREIEQVRKAKPSSLVYRQHAAGYQDRANGLAPSVTDSDYFRGYCDRIIEEIDNNAAEVKLDFYARM